MSFRLLLLSFLALTASSLSACSSNSNGKGDGLTGGDSGTSEDGAADDSGGFGLDAKSETAPPPPCSEPMDEWPTPDSQCIKTVSGKVVDTTGAPVANKTISVCGTICFYGKTGNDGTYVTNVGHHIPVATFAASVHGRPDYASLYVKLPATTADTITLPDMVVPKFTSTTDVRVPFDATSGKVMGAKTVTSGDVTLSLADGTSVELDLEDVELVMAGMGGDLFRAVKMDTANYPGWGKDVGIKLLYAGAPFDSKYDKKVGITISDAAGMAPGTPVEFVACGNEFLKTPFTAGTLQVVATGKVSADGKSIQTDPGEGLTYVTWIGVRPKM